MTRWFIHECLTGKISISCHLNSFCSDHLLMEKRIGRTYQSGMNHRNLLTKWQCVFCYHLPTDSPEVQDYIGVFMQEIHHRDHRLSGIILLYLPVLSIQPETLNIHLVKHTGKKTSNMEQRYLLFAGDFWFLLNTLYWKKMWVSPWESFTLAKEEFYSVCFSKLLWEM